MTVKERHEREENLLSKMREIGESVRDITPENGHLSLTWFPDGHMDVYLFGEKIFKEKNGSETTEMILDAWADIEKGKLQVHRL